MERIEERGRERARRLWHGLAPVDGVRLFGPGPDEPRTPTVAFAVDGIDSGDVAARLAERGVFVSHGDFYAPSVVRALGMEGPGLVRAGCACYTTRDEVDRLVEAVDDIAGG